MALVALFFWLRRVKRRAAGPGGLGSSLESAAGGGGAKGGGGGWQELNDDTLTEEALAAFGTVGRGSGSTRTAVTHRDRDDDRSAISPSVASFFLAKGKRASSSQYGGTPQSQQTRWDKPELGGEGVATPPWLSPQELEAIPRKDYPELEGSRPELEGSRPWVYPYSSEELRAMGQEAKAVYMNAFDPELAELPGNGVGRKG